MNETTNPSDHDRPGASTAQEERPAPPPRRLHRRTDQEVIGGVCAGIGDYFRIDPVIVRIAFVIAVFASGAGILAYLIAWAIIPDQDGSAELGGRAPEPQAETPPWVWAGLAVAALVVLGGATLARGPSLLVAAGLIGLGVLLFQRDTERQRAERPAASPAAAEPVAGTWGAWSAEGPPAPPAPVVARRRRGPLVRLTLGVAVGAVAVMAALAGIGGFAILPVAWTAVPLAIVGVGLLAGAVTGGARGLIGWGLVLVLASTIVAGGVRLVGDAEVSSAQATAFGEVQLTPRTVEEVQEVISLGAGSIELDLRAIPAEDLAGAAIAVNLGMGELVVIVDDEVAVRAEGSAGLGEIALFGVQSSGVRPRQAAVDPPGADGDVLSLSARVGLGEIRVERR
jgi:phage shock protein PspC (stress-responsive transcriptional regulator)